MSAEIRDAIAKSMARVNELRGLNKRAERGACCQPVRRKRQGRGQWGRCERVASMVAGDGLSYCSHHAPKHRI